MTLQEKLAATLPPRKDRERWREVYGKPLMSASIYDVARAGHNDPREGERIGAALSGARLRHEVAS